MIFARDGRQGIEDLVQPKYFDRDYLSGEALHPGLRKEAVIDIQEYDRLLGVQKEIGEKAVSDYITTQRLLPVDVSLTADK